MQLKAIFSSALVLVFASMTLTSCYLIGATGRSINRAVAPRGTDDVSRQAVFQSLREVDAELEEFTECGEDSTR